MVSCGKEDFWGQQQKSTCLIICRVILYPDIDVLFVIKKDE